VTPRDSNFSESSTIDRHILLGATLCGLGSVALYLACLAPTVQGFDSAELTMGAYDLGFVHPPGYPLYMLVGHLFSKLPLSNVGWRLNLMSAIFAGLGVAILYVLLNKQTRNAWAAFLGAAFLATAPAFWSQAVRAEVYTLHNFLMIAALLAWYFAWRTGSGWGFIPCFAILGAAAANHTTTILLWIAALASALWLEKKELGWILAGNLLGLALAAGLYLYFPWRAQTDLQIDYIRPYFGINLGSPAGLAWLVSGQAFHCLWLPQSILGQFGRLGVFLWEGTLGFGLILAGWGWWVLHISQRAWNRLLSLYLIANLGAFLAYQAIDKEVMFIPILALLSIWSASGFDAFTARIAKLRQNANPEVIRAISAIALASILGLGVALDWSNVSLKGERRTYDFARQVLNQVGPSTTIVNHWATASVFDYLRLVEGLRPDVMSFNIDFYFLGIQSGCQPINEAYLQQIGWLGRLEELSRGDRLCFIEPLHDLPKGYDWHQTEACWRVEVENP
jgi:4-amino-4-deoxy-L-arabinose transferase-like glycosyltransferase